MPGALTRHPLLCRGSMKAGLDRRVAKHPLLASGGSEATNASSRRLATATTALLTAHCERVGADDMMPAGKRKQGRARSRCPLALLVHA